MLDESKPEETGNKLVGEARCQQTAINRAAQKALKEKAVSQGLIPKAEARQSSKKEFDPILGKKVKSFMSMPSTMEEWTKLHGYLNRHKTLTGAKHPYQLLLEFIMFQ